MKDKEVKEIVDWMYSKDNPNYEYNKKDETKQETLRYFLKQNTERKNEKIHNRNQQCIRATAADHRARAQDHE